MNDFDAILNEAIAELPAPTEDPNVPVPTIGGEDTEAETVETPAADGAETPAEGETPAEEPAAAAPVEATPVAPAPDNQLAKRLAMVAKAERRQKADQANRAALDARAQPAMALVEKIQAAKATSKLEAAKIALELDEEGEAELFLELNERITGKSASATPEAKTKDLVKNEVAEALKAVEREREAAELAETEKGRKAFAAEAHEVIKAKPREFRHCAVSPPSVADIAAITEELIRAERAVPLPERVLKIIEDHRREKYEASGDTAKPEPQKTKTAPTKGEPSGKQTTPIRRNDAPVTTSTKKRTFDEELDAAIADLAHTP